MEYDVAALSFSPRGEGKSGNAEFPAGQPFVGMPGRADGDEPYAPYGSV